MFQLLLIHDEGSKYLDDCTNDDSTLNQLYFVYANRSRPNRSRDLD